MRKELTLKSSIETKIWSKTGSLLPLNLPPKKKVISKPKIWRSKIASQYIIIEPVNSCPVKCKMCSVGHADTRVKTFMQIQDAEKYMKRLRQDFGATKLLFDNWGEPLLHPEISELINLARKMGFRQIRLSSSFSVNCDLEKLVLSGLSDLCISISGLTPETYNVVHTHGNISLIKNNIKEICALRDRLHPSFKIILKWHRYKHNEHELYQAQAFAKKNKLWFIPYAGRLNGMDLLQKWHNNTLEPSFKKLVDNILFMNIMQRKISKKLTMQACNQKHRLIIDAEGNLQHCCLDMHTKGIDFLKSTTHELIAYKRKPTKWCKICLEGNFIPIANASSIRLPFRKVRC